MFTSPDEYGLQSYGPSGQSIIQGTISIHPASMIYTVANEQMYHHDIQNNQYLLQSPQHHNHQYINNPYHMFQSPKHLGQSTLLSESGSNSHKGTSIHDMPIFQLLKAFKLQQYAIKLTEIGYGEDVYKLALLNDQQRMELISQLKVLPGHKAKLMSLFDVIEEIYPKKAVIEQLKQYTTPSTHGSTKIIKGPKRVMSANPYHNQRRQVGYTRQATAEGPRSLIHQYEALDPMTKQAFNSTFLMNLEGVRGYQLIPQLFQQHFNFEDNKQAINHIFPPSYYYSDTSQPTVQTTQAEVPSSLDWNQQTGYDPTEIEQLVTKYAGSKSLVVPAGQVQANVMQARLESDQKLKSEMAQAMKVIERVNKEFEQLTKGTQKEYDLIVKLSKQQPAGGIKQSSSVQSNKSSSHQDSSAYSRQKTVQQTASVKPGTGQMKRQSSNVTAKHFPATTTKVSSKPIIPHSQNQIHQQQQAAADMGRFQSNRAMARQKQTIQPPSRIISEHELHSEMTQTTQSRFGQVVPQQKESSRQPSKERIVQQNEETKLPHPSSLIEEKAPDIGQMMEVEDKEEESLCESPIEQFKIEPDEEAIDTPKLIVNDDTPASVQPLPSRPQRKLSPLMEREERDLLWNNALGHSLDSKQVVSALGYLDLKQICLCLAHALNRHIQFSQGFYFLDDLQEQIKALNLEDQLKLDFSYELDPKLKIDFSKKKTKDESNTVSEESRREFEEIKQKMSQLPTEVAQGNQGKKGPFEYNATVQARSPCKKGRMQQISPSEDGDQFERADNNNTLLKEVDPYEHQEESVEESDDFKEAEEQYIQDYYGNNSGGINTIEKHPQKKVLSSSSEHNNNESPEGALQVEENLTNEDEPIDLDYSYSHLEDFLRSQKHAVAALGHVATSIANSQNGSVQGGGAKNATQQLMNTFLTSYNKNKGGGISARSLIKPLEVIIPEEVRPGGEESGQDDSLPHNESGACGLFKLQPIPAPNSRDLESSAHSSSTGGGNLNASNPDFSMRKIAATMSDQSRCDRIMRPSPTEALMQSIDIHTKEGFKDLVRFQMRIFDCNYDFETDQIMEDAIPDESPSLEELYYYCKYVIISGRMEKEIPILCLVYIERFLTKTGILLNHLNWKRLTLIALCLASKIWDDDSLENVHFPKVMPDVTLKEIAALEKVFLQFLDFDLLMRGAEYAKYYFVLKTFANEQLNGGMNSCLPPVGPLTAQKMSDLQNNTAKVESELRDRYQLKLSLQKTM